MRRRNIVTFLGESDHARYLTTAVFAAQFVVFGLHLDPPGSIAEGLWRIIGTSDILITDYIAVGGAGAAFVNAGLLMMLSVCMLMRLGVRFTGVSAASIFLMGSFALFGKNLFNIWPIIFGVWLYSRVRGEPFARHVYTALFGTSMAPVVTELIFVVDLPLWERIPLGLAAGASIGLLLPPLAAQMTRVHRGFNLYNTGFTAGVLGTIYVSIFKSYGYEVSLQTIWSTGRDLQHGIFLSGLFALMIAAGLIIQPSPGAALKRIFACSGRLGTDFIETAGYGAALINMGINGMAAAAYVLLVGGPLNGPTMGGILTVAGFGAFGKHIRNISPVLLGVFLGSLTKVWSINDPGILLAALFGTSLAPISGHYGWVWGVAAGFINSSVVLSSGVMHGGMNLYNTGFSAGLVAAVMVPLLDVFLKKKKSDGATEIVLPE